MPAIVGLVVVLVLGGLGWWWYRSRGGEPGPTGPLAADTMDTSMAEAPEAPPLDLPELDASDELVRRLVSGLSARPQLASWIVTDDLVRRFVISVVNVAQGASPASHLPSLAPADSFRVLTGNGSLLVDSASYHRYDRLAETLVSLDTRGTARLYHQLLPLMQEAYGELGITDRSFQETLALAFGRLLDVQVPEGPVELTPTGAVYGFSDPQLEAMTPVEKQMLRLGPANARRVQAKLRQLANAMGITPVAPEG